MAKKIVRVIHLDAKAATGSLKKMQAEAAKLQNALNAGLVPKKDRKAAIKHLQKLRGGIKNIRQEYAGTNTIIGKLKQSIGRGIGPMLIGAMSIQSVLSGFKMLVGSIINFQKSVSSLRSITGASREDLVFYRNEARRTGTELRMMASEVINAYKIVGSAKPELLKNKEALTSVTKEAIILSHAAELELTPAVEALTDVMNQFDLPANQARRTINTLAAGSKEGAAIIPLIQEAILEFGVSAKTANISIEQSVGAIETLAEKGLKGSRAGVQLRNVFSKLEQSADKNLRPSVVGLSAALTNLNAKQLDAGERAKLFGERNAQGALILTQNIDRFNELTIAVTGTDRAYIQARINQDNLLGDIDQFKTTWSNLILALENGEGILAKSIRTFVSIGIELGKVATAAADSEDASIPWYERLILLTTAQGRYELKIRETLKTQIELNNESRISERTQKMLSSAISLSSEALQNYKENLKSQLTTLDETSEKYLIYKGVLEEIAIFEKAEAKAAEKTKLQKQKLAEEIASNTIGIIKKIDQERVKAIEDDQTREQAILDVKLKNQIKEIEALNANEEKKAELISAVTTRIEKEKEAIQTKYAEAKTAKDNKFILDGLELELTALEDGSVEKLAAYQKYLDTKMEMELSSLDLTEQEKDIIRQNYKALKDEAENEAEENKAAEKLEKLELSAQMSQDVLDGYIGVRANRDKAEIQRIQKESNTKIDILKNELASKLKNQNLTDTQKQKLQEEYQAKIDAIQEESDSKQAAIKLKAWKREKTANILSAIINTALAITKASPNIPLQIAAGITGATQLAVIKSTKPPEFVDGGFTGQNTIYDDAHGGVTGVVHKNEWVAPEWMTTNPATANYINMLEGIRQNGFADGGFTSSTSQEETPQFDAETESLGIETALLAVAASNAKLTEVLNQPILAVYDQDQILTIRDEINVFNSIQSNNTIS